jgi:tRNA(His) 5'-end guanylyltransferase
MVGIINEAKIYYAAGDKIPGDKWLNVGEITRKEAEGIPKGITSDRVDEMLFYKFGPPLYNNNLRTVRDGGEYRLEVRSDLKPEHKE